MKRQFVTVDVFTDRKFGGNPLAAPQPFTLGETLPSELVAQACGLTPDQIETGAHRPVIASTGNNFVFAEVKSRAVLKSATYNTEIFVKHLPMARAVGI